jgi:triphosphoribosyl-dephospho-CoA synthase
LPRIESTIAVEAGRSSLGRLVEAACVLEARARKPGNVHPDASFGDMTYGDFVQSAHVIAPRFDQAAALPLGQLVLQSVEATRQLLGKNTNLGIILVLAPLAKAARPDRESVAAVLEALGPQDAYDVYETLRLAAPGGLGQVADQDVSQTPTVPLMDAMRLAADRDLIARQYATGYDDVFSMLLPTFERGVLLQWPIEQAIIHTQLVSIATLGDTLIRRKCGEAVAAEAKRRAKDVLETCSSGAPFSLEKLHLFDRWLRADGHRRNPGTTADLLAGVLFLALRRGSIEVSPPHWACPDL